MSFTGAPYGETVTFHGRQLLADKDRYGNDQFVDVDVDVEGCAVWPRGAGSELVQAQDTVIGGLTVLAPAGSAVPAAIDEATVRGQRYLVDGPPFAHHNPITGDDGGVEIQLTRITG